MERPYSAAFREVTIGPRTSRSPQDSADRPTVANRGLVASARAIGQVSSSSSSCAIRSATAASGDLDTYAEEAMPSLSEADCCEASA